MGTRRTGLLQKHHTWALGHGMEWTYKPTLSPWAFVCFSTWLPTCGSGQFLVVFNRVLSFPVHCCKVLASVVSLSIPAHTLELVALSSLSLTLEPRFNHQLLTFFLLVLIHICWCKVGHVSECECPRTLLLVLTTPTDPLLGPLMHLVTSTYKPNLPGLPVCGVQFHLKCYFFFCWLFYFFHWYCLILFFLADMVTSTVIERHP